MPAGTDPLAETFAVPQHEIAVAQEIQGYLLPSQVPMIEGYELSAYYHPCAYIGGDYYDFIELDAEHLGILVADVSGKGLPGAMVMVQTRTLMRAEAKQTLSPREAMVRMNRGLAGEIPKNMFVTMFYALLNIPRSELTICSAGHNAMMIWRQRASRCAAVTTNGLALGIDKGPRFEKSVQETTIPFDPGDRFIIYTDGLSEAMNSEGELFGIERLAAKFRHFSTTDCSGFITTLLASLNGFRAGAPPSDDLTFITGRRLDASPTRPAPQLVRGERYLSCGFCGEVNERAAERCTVCKEPLAASGPIRLAVGEGEIECPCGHVIRLTRQSSGCLSCGRALCRSCRRRIATIRDLCAMCATTYR